MSELLSHEQIAALVEAAKEGHLPDRDDGRGRRARRVREIDFSRPTKFTQEQQRRIERSHESFCRATATRLTGELRMAVELELINVAQLTWASSLTEVPAASIFAVIECAPLGSRMVLSAETSAVVWMIERLLGGIADPGSPRPLHRDLTEIELTLTQRLFETILAQLSMTWEELVGVELRVVELETAVANVQVAPPSEPTLAMTIEVRAEATSSTVSILVPYRSIEPVVEKIPTGHYSELLGETTVDEATTTAVRRALGGVEIELRVEVGGIDLTIDQVLSLKEGDVIRLGTSSAAGVLLCAGPVPIHRGRPGRSGRRRAVSVVERMEAVE